MTASQAQPITEALPLIRTILLTTKYAVLKSGHAIKKRNVVSKISK